MRSSNASRLVGKTGVLHSFLLPGSHFPYLALMYVPRTGSVLFLERNVSWSVEEVADTMLGHAREYVKYQWVFDVKSECASTGARAAKPFFFASRLAVSYVVLYAVCCRAHQVSSRASFFLLYRLYG
ncbi:unnamed protein product [Ectocarpus sp. 13 AM-2016]